MRHYLQHGTRHGYYGTDPASDISAAAYLWNGVSDPRTITTGVGTAVTWTNFQRTSDIFNTDTTASPVQQPPYNNTTLDSYLYFTALGAYIAAASGEFESGAYKQSVNIVSPGSQYELNQTSFSDLFEDLPTNISTGVGGNWAPSSFKLFYVDSQAGPGIISLGVEQTSGSNKNLVTATLGVFYLGLSRDLAVVY